MNVSAALTFLTHYLEHRLIDDLAFFAAGLGLLLLVFTVQEALSSKAERTKR